MSTPAIRRRFIDLPHGQMHCREAGCGGTPVLLVHGSPGSSRQLVRLIAGLAHGRPVLAPDTPGNGDSEPLVAPDVPALAAALLAGMDALGLPAAHVYGTHTGAAIATELALLAPGRVRTLALEGVGLFEGELQAELLARYTPNLAPELDGTHLLRAFQFCRDQALFFPWYRHTASASRGAGLPAAADLQALVLEVLKAHASYAANYHAAFRWDPRPRLPLLACPLMLLASQTDPLHDMTCRAAAGRHRFTSLPPLASAEFASARLAALDALFACG